MGEILVVRRLGDHFFRARARGATGQSKIAAIIVFRRPAPRRLFLGPATFLPLLVDTLSIFLVVALPPSKDLFPVRLVPPRIISTALLTALLALAFVIGNTMLAVLGAPCLEIGAAAFPLLLRPRRNCTFKRRAANSGSS
jgi:hypothetical protein